MKELLVNATILGNLSTSFSEDYGRSLRMESSSNTHTRAGAWQAGSDWHRSPAQPCARATTSQPELPARNWSAACSGLNQPTLDQLGPRRARRLDAPPGIPTSSLFFTAMRVTDAPRPKATSTAQRMGTDRSANTAAVPSFLNPGGGRGAPTPRDPPEDRRARAAPSPGKPPAAQQTSSSPSVWSARSKGLRRRLC